MKLTQAIFYVPEFRIKELLKSEEIELLKEKG